MTNARTPIWHSIASTLSDEIARGTYAVGDKLPTEAALSARFGVNRHTVRHALAHLSGEGLVHARRGAGVYVMAKPLDYPLSERTRFHQNLMAAGRMPAKTVLDVEVRGAATDEARRLDIAPGAPVAVSRSLSYADDTPVALAESCFPEVRWPGLGAALQEHSSVTRAFAAIGIADYTRASTRLTAVTADAGQALHLRVREGAPLLLTEALSLDTDRRPVEYGRTWFASDRITLTLDHDAAHPS